MLIIDRFLCVLSAVVILQSWVVAAMCRQKIWAETAAHPFPASACASDGRSDVTSLCWQPLRSWACCTSPATPPSCSARTPPFSDPGYDLRMWLTASTTGSLALWSRGTVAWATICFSTLASSALPSATTWPLSFHPTLICWTFSIFPHLKGVSLCYEIPSPIRTSCQQSTTLKQNTSTPRGTLSWKDTTSRGGTTEMWEMSCWTSILFSTNPSKPKPGATFKACASSWTN